MGTSYSTHVPTPPCMRAHTPHAHRSAPLTKNKSSTSRRQASALTLAPPKEL